MRKEIKIQEHQDVEICWNTHFDNLKGRTTMSGTADSSEFC